MTDKYYTVTVKVSENDLKEYLKSYYDEEEIEDLDLQDESTEIVREVLGHEFSDYFCIDNRTLVVGDF